MIPIEKLRQVSTIYTHAHCPDGMATAMILKDAFRMLGMEPRIEFLVHNTREHAVASQAGQSGIALWCDIAPKAEPTAERAGLNEAWARSRDFIVLDHHAGTRDIVEAFGENGVYADAVTEPGVSGATLAFREVWDPVCLYANPPHHRSREADLVRDFAECSGIRDCWVTSDPRFLRGQWISKMIMVKPASYWLDDDGKGRPLMPYLNAAEMEGGRCLYEAHLDTVRQALNQTVLTRFRWESADRDVWLVVFQENACGAHLTSDVAEMIRNDTETPTDPLCVASFCYLLDKPGAEPKLSWSLRGVNGFDVQKFAHANGGNGHVAAAGFSTALAPRERTFTPYREIRSALAAYLSSTAPL